MEHNWRWRSGTFEISLKEQQRFIQKNTMIRVKEDNKNSAFLTRDPQLDTLCIQTKASGVHLFLKNTFSPDFCTSLKQSLIHVTTPRLILIFNDLALLSRSRPTFLKLFCYIPSYLNTRSTEETFRSVLTMWVLPSLLPMSQSGKKNEVHLEPCLNRICSIGCATESNLWKNVTLPKNSIQLNKTLGNKHTWSDWFGL